jgi:hypothetical protein
VESSRCDGASGKNGLGLEKCGYRLACQNFVGIGVAGSSTGDTSLNTGWAVFHSDLLFLPKRNLGDFGGGSGGTTFLEVGHEMAGLFRRVNLLISFLFIHPIAPKMSTEKTAAVTDPATTPELSDAVAESRIIVVVGRAIVSNVVEGRPEVEDAAVVVKVRVVVGVEPVEKEVWSEFRMHFSLTQEYPKGQHPFPHLGRADVSANVRMGDRGLAVTL